MTGIRTNQHIERHGIARYERHVEKALCGMPGLSMAGRVGGQACGENATLPQSSWTSKQ